MEKREKEQKGGDRVSEKKFEEKKGREKRR